MVHYSNTGYRSTQCKIVSIIHSVLEMGTEVHLLEVYIFRSYCPGDVCRHIPTLILINIPCTTPMIQLSCLHADDIHWIAVIAACLCSSIHVLYTMGVISNFKDSCHHSCSYSSIFYMLLLTTRACCLILEFTPSTLR